MARRCKLTRQKAIRAKCLDCVCGQRREVTLCDMYDCPLWHYRLGYEVDSDGNKVTRKVIKDDE